MALKLSLDKLSMEAGKTQKIETSGGTGTIEWKSDNLSVAVIKASETGNSATITSIINGTANITATDGSGTTVTCVVTVMAGSFFGDGGAITPYMESVEKYIETAMGTLGGFVAGAYEWSAGQVGIGVNYVENYLNPSGSNPISKEDAETLKTREKNAEKDVFAKLIGLPSRNILPILATSVKLYRTYVTAKNAITKAQIISSLKDLTVYNDLPPSTQAIIASALGTNPKTIKRIVVIIKKLATVEELIAAEDWDGLTQFMLREYGKGSIADLDPDIQALISGDLFKQAVGNGPPTGPIITKNPDGSTTTTTKENGITTKKTVFEDGSTLTTTIGIDGNIISYKTDKDGKLIYTPPETPEEIAAKAKAEAEAKALAEAKAKADAEAKAKADAEAPIRETVKVIYEARNKSKGNYVEYIQYVGEQYVTKTFQIDRKGTEDDGNGTANEDDTFIVGTTTIKLIEFIAKNDQDKITAIKQAIR